MKRNLYISLCVILVVILGGVMFKVLQPKPIWRINAEEFESSFNVISGDTTIDDLSGFTTFEWDTLYSFAPYTPEQTIYEVVGYKWDNISSTVNEGMNQIVFLKDGRVVCYINGYPDKYKVYFNFGQYDGVYFKLTTSDKLKFNMTVTHDGIRYFEYIK